MLNKIYEDTNLSQTLAPAKQISTFKAIDVHIVGTNDTGNTLAINEVGRVTYEKNGRTLIDADFEYLFHLSDGMGGAPRFSSTIAAAVDIYLSIPRNLNDDNVEAVIPSDNAIVKISHPAEFNSQLASGTVAVYLDESTGAQNYNMTIMQLTKDITGTGSIPFDIENENIYLIAISAKVSSLITTVGSNLTRIRTEVESQIGQASLAALLGQTSHKMQYETYQTKFVVPYIADGDITGRLTDSVKMTFDTSGASQVEVLVLGAKFDLERQKKTKVAQRTRFNTLTQRKIQQGKGSQVEAVNNINQ